MGVSIGFNMRGSHINMKSHYPVTFCFHETGLPTLFHELTGSVKRRLGVAKLYSNKKESISSRYTPPQFSL